MAKKQQTKDQHTVPESYLRLFLKEDQLYTLDFLKIRKGWNEFPKKRSPGGICYASDYYTIKADFPANDFKLKEHDSHFIEDEVLTSLENKYPKLWQLLIEERQMTLQDAADFSDFVVTLKLRNPYWFEKVIQKNLKTWTAKLLPELIAEKKKQDPRARRMSEWIFEYITDILKQNQEDDADYAKQFQLFSLIARYTDHSDRNKLMREKVIDCTWKLHIAPADGPYFITTDNPGAAVGTFDKLYHTIKLDGGFTFYFPLSYRYALVFSDDDKDHAYTQKMKQKMIYPVQLNAEQVHRTNDVLIQVASKLLIAAEPAYLNAIAAINKPAQ